MLAISRRHFLAGASAAPGLLGQARRPPNLLVILTDDQGFGDFDYQGNKDLETPNLARLARESVTFSRFSVSPVCAPTRAALMTGRYPLRTNVHGVTGGRETLRKSEVTMGEVFQRAGYRTGLIGKWHLGECYPYVPHARGFNDFVGFRVGHWSNYFDAPAERNGRPVRLPGYITEAFTSEAIDWIGTRPRDPWFCYLAYNVPHTPYQAPEADYRRHAARGHDPELAAVYAMIENMDRQVGRILGHLQSTGELDNTIVAFFCDNGPNGERYRCGLRGRKGSIYEGGTRSVLSVRWPGGQLRGGRKVEQIAAHIDLLPTFMELCGARRPEGPPLDGRSLAPLLRGEAASWPERRLYCHADHQRDARNPFPGAVWDQRWKLVNGRELYDLRADPGESADVSARHPEVVKPLRGAYDEWFASTLEGFRFGAPPIEVGHAEENPSVLPATQAALEGGPHYRAKMGYANDFIVNWRTPEDRMTWRADVRYPGRYLASLESLCPKENLGCTVRLQAGGAAVEGALREAGDLKEIPLRNIVESAVHAPEMNWTNAAIGELELRAGTVDVTLSAVKVPGRGVADVKSVRLRRLGPI
jgi:arylsulfatase A-like enzyme